MLLVKREIRILIIIMLVMTSFFFWIDQEENNNAPCYITLFRNILHFLTPCVHWLLVLGENNKTYTICFENRYYTLILSYKKKASCLNTIPLSSISSYHNTKSKKKQLLHNLFMKYMSFSTTKMSSTYF